MSDNLITTEKLAGMLLAPNFVIIDTSWHLPAAKRNAKAEFVEAHIPGAQFYDLDAGAADNTTLPHMLPTAEKFSRDLQVLGVGDDTLVVCYDAVGLFSAARLWWMLKSFGHAQVAVLDGGLPEWRRENRALEIGEAQRQSQRPFTPFLQSDKVKSLLDVAKALESQSVQIADARSGSRFRGEEAESRPGVRPGHMPGSANVHYASLLNADGTLKSGQALRQAFVAAGINLERPIITSCGSGVTAAILTLGLTELGVKDHALYDGSWAEWGASDQAVVTG